ncbi:MAG: hypothetical protein HC936_19035 [Leptolyngbyaceae cyanobacterium SU_3_3]|nr:hypothetical protein [Leptolyngbyaceae cyanobacterium SU_3_3]
MRYRYFTSELRIFNLPPVFVRIKHLRRGVKRQTRQYRCSLVNNDTRNDPFAHSIQTTIAAIEKVSLAPSPDWQRAGVRVRQPYS